MLSLVRHTPLAKAAAMVTRFGELLWRLVPNGEEKGMAKFTECVDGVVNIL